MFENIEAEIDADFESSLKNSMVGLTWFEENPAELQKCI